MRRSTAGLLSPVLRRKAKRTAQITSIGNDQICHIHPKKMAAKATIFINLNKNLSAEVSRNYGREIFREVEEGQRENREVDVLFPRVV